MARQIFLDGYIDAGVIVALALANQLTRQGEGNRESAKDVVARILSFDAQSAELFRLRHVPGFVSLAGRLRDVFEHLLLRDIEVAADALNTMLAEHPAHPHLAKESGVWRLHHHPADAPLIGMYTSICAEALARMIGEGLADRFGRCEATACTQLFFDSSKNGTRRFCSTTCQSRTKTAAFRQRQRSAGVRAR